MYNVILACLCIHEILWSAYVQKLIEPAKISCCTVLYTG